ncbi:Protein phosphatase 1E [Desmophyllum pertusum]|uniref:Protein phosphatase 1E n=1 Tax=Desmophyllum pertusum TaxID=174260 RepID=A0A9W9ZV07_9CNID|nr:Protein phosphatase 1E [Desmophyllum pertusum]
MSVLFTEEENRETIEFLRQFVALRPNAFGDDEPLPFRVTPLSISVNEIEGECIEWCLQYLNKSEIPEVAAALVTHAAVKQIVERDISIYKQDETEDYLALLDSPQIAKDVINKVVEVCMQWDSEPPCFYKLQMKYESYVHAIKNTRRKMEDKHVILPQFNSLFGFPQEYTNQAFFAVYDGHSGVDASSYAATHLHHHLARSKNIDTDPRLALKEAFEKTDECFVAKAKREGRLKKKRKPSNNNKNKHNKLSKTGFSGVSGALQPLVPESEGENAVVMYRHLHDDRQHTWSTHDGSDIEKWEQYNGRYSMSGK